MTTPLRSGYKILTHDWQPPIQGGAPLCDGSHFPVTLPVVSLDTSSKECGAGYNYCETLHQAAKIAGYWSTGYSSRCVVVEASPDAIERGAKRRCSQLTIVREATHGEILASMEDLLRPIAPRSFLKDLALSQFEWYEALKRPLHNQEKVVSGLKLALEARGLSSWQLREYQAARDAWTAWTARTAWTAQAARTAWAAWTAQAAQAAWAAWAAQDALTAWAAWTAQAAQAAWAAWAAQDALTFEISCTLGWLDDKRGPHYLTAGIRDAYANGLALAIPVKRDTLGYVMSV